jgi:Cu(I)/Ag(I) efflux system membrane fusion protein
MSYLSYGLDPNQKKDNSASNEIALSDQQIKLGNITTQNIEETNNSLKESYTGVLTVNQEQIQTISARAMGRIEKLYFKTTVNMLKKIKLFISCIVKIYC